MAGSSSQASFFVGSDLTVLRILTTNRNPELWANYDLCEMSNGTKKARCKNCAKFLTADGNTTLKNHLTIKETEAPSSSPSTYYASGSREQPIITYRRRARSSETPIPTIDFIPTARRRIEDLNNDVRIMEHHLEELHDQVTNLTHHRETIQELTEREQENTKQIIILGYKLEEMQNRTRIIEGRTERNIDRINFISEHVEGMMKGEEIKEIRKEVNQIKERVGATQQEVNEVGKCLTINVGRIADLEQKMEHSWDQRMDRVEKRLEELATLTDAVLESQASIIRGDHLLKE